MTKMAAAMQGVRNLTFCRLKVLRPMFFHSTTKSYRKRTAKGKNKDEANKAERNDLYRDMITERLQEADRSLLLQLKSKDRLASVLAHVETKIGQINKGFYFKNYSSKSKDLVLIEFSSDKMLQSNAESRVRGTKQLKNMAIPQEDSLMEKITTYEHKPFCCTALNDCVDVSDQIRYLYKTRTMSEAVIRLQFFICMLIEKSLEAEIDGLKVLPFGSWSCGFALDGTSDVDVSIVHNHGKGILGHVSHLFDKSSLFDKIAFISRARVPIVKLIQTQTGVSCDICSNGLAGLYTAEILYLLNMYADVFCPLTLAVKVIAKQHNLSESGMSSKYSSFMLTMMVLSYLQQEGILPALKNLNMERHSRSSDSLKKWKETKFRTPKRRLTNICPEKDLGELLVGFFQYYRTFPFKHLIMDPYFGKVVESAHSDQVCIINPIESDHNICRNVSYTEVNRFKDACSKFSEDLVANARKTSDGTCWGLASILQVEKFQLKEKAKLRTNIDMFYNFDYDSIDDVYVSMDGENDSVVFDGKAVNGEKVTHLGHNDAKQKQVNDSVDEDLLNNDPFFSRSRRGNKNKKKRYINKQDTGVKNS